MWVFFILGGMLTAFVVIYLLRAIKSNTENHFLSSMVMTVIPVFGLAGYLLLGHPDLPAHTLNKESVLEQDTRLYVALAARPMDVLLRQDSNDLGALRVMGQLNMKMDKPDEALKFFDRARRVARAQKSVFYDVITEEYQAAAARARTP